MRWASKDNERKLATPKSKAICPLCKEEVISKCGKIKVWHWSHKTKHSCDKWGEPESLWHLNWKKEFPKECQEVLVKYSGDRNRINHYIFKNKRHFADIKTNRGTIIELQNSSLSSKDIEEREEFYKDVIWILNGDKFGKNLILRPKGDYYSFRWKHPPKSWWYAKKPIYIDLEEELFLIKKLYTNIPCGGWGILVSKEDFLKECGVNKNEIKG